MPRVKGTTARARRKKILKLAKGYYGSRSTLYKTAHEQVMKSLAYAYRDRKQRKREFRKLWISRINAGAVANGIKYSRLIHGLSLANVTVNRKVLADLAVNEPIAFTAYCELAKQAIANPTIKVSAPVKKFVAPKAETKPVTPVKVEKVTKVAEEKPAPVKVEKPVAVKVEKAVKEKPAKKEVVKAAPKKATPKVAAKKTDVGVAFKVEGTDAPLESLLVDDLKLLASKAGITGYSKMKKADLIEALKNLK